jgi:hypothetical protein
MGDPQYRGKRDGDIPSNDRVQARPRTDLLDTTI